MSDAARVSLAVVVVSLTLHGCGVAVGPVTQRQNPDGTTTLTVPLTPIGGPGGTAARRLPPPGPGSRGGVDTPDLGGGGPGQPATPPPNLTAAGKPPSGNLTFDPDTQGVLDRYHIRIAGRDATPDNVTVVTRAAQLYQGRSHVLMMVLQRDPSKLPVAGVWYPMGSNATSEIYQPQMQHVVDHEMGHDLTIRVNGAAGQRLGNTIVANRDDPSVFPTSYSRTRVPEAMAEALSWWAEKAARPGSGNPYDPPPAVVADLQPFLADTLKNR